MGILYRIYDRIFHHDKWSIGLVENSAIHLEQGILPTPVQWLSPRFGRFIADPFVFHHNGKEYLLFEEYTYSKGSGKNKIAELLLDSNGRYGLHNEQLIVAEPFHQSYPFVFSDKGTVYCVPEQAESNSIRMYRAEKFPSNWVLDSVLIKDFPGVDPTIVHHGGYWWLFATRGGQQDSELHAWYSTELRGEWLPHAGNPIKVDPGRVRPAGPFYLREGALYRPVQVCLHRYGDGGLLINKVEELTPSRFSEKSIAQIEPSPQYPKGLHHFCAGETLAVIDGNQFAGPMEIVLKFVGIVKKRVTIH